MLYEVITEMNISRPTFARLIEGARKKLVEFLITGKKLSISGGNVHFKNNVYKCLDCEQMFVKSINDIVSVCPSCNSHNVASLAGGFGHGKCCIENIS